MLRAKPIIITIVMIFFAGTSVYAKEWGENKSACDIRYKVTDEAPIMERPTFEAEKVQTALVGDYIYVDSGECIVDETDDEWIKVSGEDYYLYKEPLLLDTNPNYQKTSTIFVWLVHSDLPTGIGQVLRLLLIFLLITFLAILIYKYKQHKSIIAKHKKTKKTTQSIFKNRNNSIWKQYTISLCIGSCFFCAFSITSTLFGLIFWLQPLLPSIIVCIFLFLSLSLILFIYVPPKSTNGKWGEISIALLIICISVVFFIKIGLFNNTFPILSEIVPFLSKNWPLLSDDFLLVWQYLWIYPIILIITFILALPFSFLLSKAFAKIKSWAKERPNYNEKSYKKLEILQNYTPVPIAIIVLLTISSLILHYQQTTKDVNYQQIIKDAEDILQENKIGWSEAIYIIEDGIKEQPLSIWHKKNLKERVATLEQDKKNRIHELRYELRKHFTTKSDEISDFEYAVQGNRSDVINHIKNFLKELQMLDPDNKKTKNYIQKYETILQKYNNTSLAL